MDGDSQAKSRRVVRCPEYATWVWHGLNTLLLLVVGGLAVAVLVNQGVIIAGQQAAIVESGEGEGAALSVLSNAGGVPALLDLALAKLMSLASQGDRIEATIAPCGAACNQVAFSGFGPALNGRSLVGKNVLVVGGSRGIGCGAVKAFLDAGANVVATSRNPSKYPMPVDRYQEPGDCQPGSPEYTDPTRCWPLCPNVSPIPLELLSRASIENFFATDPTVVTWSSIDVLVLGGIPVTLWQHNTGDASEDKLIRYKAEVIGRSQVMGAAYSRLKLSADARVITLASIAGLIPALATGNYVETKMASVGAALQWNMAREQLSPLGLESDNITMMSFEAAAVNTSLIHVLSNAIGNGHEPLWASGGTCASDYPAPGNYDMLNILTASEITAVSLGMSERRAGDAILWMATVANPNTRYAVADDTMPYCISNDPENVAEYGTLAEFANRWAFHRDVGAATKRFAYMRAAVAYNNVIALNSFDYNELRPLYFVCPVDLKYKIPSSGVPSFLKVAPIRNNFCCDVVGEQPPQTLTGAFIADLCDDPCKVKSPAYKAACDALVATPLLASVPSILTSSPSPSPTPVNPYAEALRIARLAVYGE